MEFFFVRFVSFHKSRNLVRKCSVRVRGGGAGPLPHLHYTRRFQHPRCCGLSPPEAGPPGRVQPPVAGPHRTRRRLRVVCRLPQRRPPLRPDGVAVCRPPPVSCTTEMNVCCVAVGSSILSDLNGSIWQPTGSSQQTIIKYLCSFLAVTLENTRSIFF